jgi:hypothetical protein
VGRRSDERTELDRQRRQHKSARRARRSRRSLTGMTERAGARRPCEGNDEEQPHQTSAHTMAIRRTTVMSSVPVRLR